MASKHEAIKRPSRREREQKILIEVVEYYIKTGRPVGSHALQGETILDVSSATIRNYFAALESDGFLKQQHTSGGRIPQPKAFSVYARHCCDEVLYEEERRAKAGEDSALWNKRREFSSPGSLEPTEVVSYIHDVMHSVAQETSMAVVATAPRFDHDSIVDVKYVYLDARRLIAVLVTEFGLVHTMMLTSSLSLTQGIVKKAERFARMRLFQESTNGEIFDEGEIEVARTLYQEAMASYFVMYSSVSEEDLFRVGFSNLLSFPEFKDTSLLAPAMALFENGAKLRGLLRETCRSGNVKFWVGDELDVGASSEPMQVSMIAVPYKVGAKAVGACALLGPIRMAYKDAFRLMHRVGQELSRQLTTTLMKHRISYRMPESHPVMVDEAQRLSLEFRPQRSFGEQEHI